MRYHQSIKHLKLPCPSCLTAPSPNSPNALSEITGCATRCPINPNRQSFESHPTYRRKYLQLLALSLRVTKLSEPTECDFESSLDIVKYLLWITREFEALLLDLGTAIILPGADASLSCPMMTHFHGRTPNIYLTRRSEFLSFTATSC